MSNRKVVCFVVLGAVSVTLAAYSAFAQRSTRALAAEQEVFALAEPQVSNRAAKTSRLVIQASLTTVANQPIYALASAMPDADFGRPANPAIAAAPVIPAETPAPAVAPTPAAAAPVAPPETKSAAVPAPHEKPADKPKKLPPPPPAPQASNGLLDDGQISGLKGRLRLTEDQAGYWPAVEAALRDLARTHLRGSVKPHGGKVNIDVNSPEVQKLIWAAMPLLMRLREDQKTEVRKLARVIGLEQVASQI